ncbi:unnamed protein product [Lupinus luteus]|uniref:Uncharacterized protein n=1 Tax=Lupinus luteus TaxID=3873 RepID=A0AAV1XXL7_LUPLU
MIETEGMKGGVGGRVGAGEDDVGDGMQCIDHPFRNNNNPGGICAICLQEKLAKLVSSSFPLPIPPSTSSSSSPSFSSNNVASTSSSTIRPSPSTTLATLTTPPPPPPPPPSTATSLMYPTNGTDSDHHHHLQYCTRRARIPFLLPKKKKKPAPTPNNPNVVILKRSKSTATPSSRGNFAVDADHADEDLTSHRKRNGFWSFLYLSSNSKSSSSTKKLKSKSFRDPTRISSTINVPNTSSSTTLKAKEKCKSEIVVVEDDNNSCNSNTTTASAASSFERKVSRSRSVGCGSRSFSGDFFERISTGFGDCTLRRVESQREGKTKVNNAAATASGAAMNRERVRCGGLFSGFMMTSSSSSSSSSSSYWVSSSATENNNNDSTMNNGKSVALSHGRAKSWGWAFASPIRAFTTKPSSRGNRRDIVRDAKDKNATPNLSAIPSLLSATG